MDLSSSRRERRIRRTRPAAAGLLLLLAAPGLGVAGAPDARAAGLTYDVEVLGGYSDASGVAVGADGTAYVVDASASSVYAVDRDGSSTDVGVEDLVEPQGIAVKGDQLYIADTGNHRVVKVGIDGGAPTRIAGSDDATPGAPVPGAAASSPLNAPRGVAVDAKGDLYIADTGNNQVEKVVLSGGSPTLSVIAGTGAPADQSPGVATSSPLRAPEDVVVAGGSQLLVADTGNQAVASISGGSLQTAATGAAFRAVGADIAGGAVTARGADVVRLGSRTPLATAEEDVQGVAVAPDGTVWVAAGSKVLLLRPSADGLSSPRITSSGPTLAAKGLALESTFTATGVPAPRWSLLGAPTTGFTALAIDPATGVLTGTPTAVPTGTGKVTFTVRAQNSEGHDDRLVTLTVGNTPAAPATVTAAAGPSSAVVSWKPAAASSVAAEAVTGWVVTPTTGGTAGQPVRVTSGSATSATVRGLATGASTTFTVAAVNAFGTGTASAASAAVLPWSGAVQPAAGLTRLEGAGRVQTAIRTSQQLFPSGASARAVVLASSTNYADSLAGARLASAVGAPLLLNPGTALSPAVGDEVKRVLAVPATTTKTGTSGGSTGSSTATKGKAAPSTVGTVFLLGGAGALSADVEAAAKALSTSYTVVRIAGTDRFATAAAVAAQVDVDAPVDDAPVYVASGTNFPDGLAVAALAARTGGVVVLSDGAKMPAATSAYLAARDPAGERVVPVGGPAAAAVGARGAAPARGGAARDPTSRLVANRLLAVAGPSGARTVGLATGENWPDALAGAAAMGNLGGPLLLTPSHSLSPAAESWLSTLVNRPTAGLVLGGTASVDDGVGSSFARLLRR